MRNYLMIGVVGLVLAAHVLAVHADSDDRRIPNLGHFFQERPLKQLSFSKRLNGSDITKVDVANIGYVGSSGSFKTVYDLYVTGYYAGGQPQIIGYVEGGFDPELLIKDLDQDGKDEVLLKYHVGAHTSGYKIYEITYDGTDNIKEIAGDKITSNLDSITLDLNAQQHRYEFAVKNVEDVPYSIAPPPNTEAKLTTDIYALSKGKLVLVKETSEIEPSN